MIILALLLSLNVPLWSDERPQAAISEAARLRDNRQFDEAVKVLERYLEQNPKDVEAARLRAQTLYWLKQYERARRAYADALVHHPNHEILRLEYAQMLAETGDLRDARMLLEAPDRRVGSAEGDALLGTIHYWSGDLTAARKLFVAALRKDPAHQSAARQLREIDTASAPWLRITPSIWHDDQPLDRGGLAFEAGWFATPLLSVAVRSQPERFTARGSRTFWTTEAEVSHVAPAARLETRVAAGMFRRPEEADAIEWFARGELALRATGGVTLRGRIERSPYLYTVASLETPITSDTLAGVFQWKHRRGWLAEAAVQRQRFPDDNNAQSAYAWLLAPVGGSEPTRLQLGYAVAASDADDPRFVLARPEQAVSPSDPQFDFSGAYRPYYTPARIVSHSLIGAVTAGGSSSPVVRAGGSYGFRAHEDAIAFFPIGNEVGAVTGRRSFRPWTVRGSIEIPISRAVVVSARAESGRAAFHRWTTGSAHLLLRLLPRGGGRSHLQ